MRAWESDEMWGHERKDRENTRDWGSKRNQKHAREQMKMKKRNGN
jgi:hypothetical protein